MLDDEKYYKISELVKKNPIFGAKGYLWVWKQVLAGNLKAVNTNVEKGGRPRYLISGKWAKRFIKSLTISSN